MFSKRFERFPETIELPKQALERKYDSSIITEKYANLIERNENKINQNAKNIEKIGNCSTFNKQRLFLNVKSMKIVS